MSTAPGHRPGFPKGEPEPAPETPASRAARLLLLDLQIDRTRERIRRYREAGDDRSLELQRHVLNRQLDERLELAPPRPTVGPAIEAIP